MFDSLLEGLRCHSSERLESRRREVVAGIRHLQAEELAIVRVLDERGRIDVSVGCEGESARTVREKVETARALESLPAVAAAACDGRFSDEQLRSVVRLADEETDAEWAVRAPNVGPADLARLARTKRTPSSEEGLARHDARSFTMWWQKDRGMLQLRGELPDVMGAKFEAAINRITERMRPAKGQSWDLPERRRADALLELCEAWEAGPAGPQLSQPLLVVEVPESGPSEVVGIPLPDAMVEQLRATASIEPVLVDHAGVPSSIGKRSSGLSPKVARAVLLRDGHCRCESECDVTYGLHVHHIRPSSWGGSDDPSNLIAITASHHPPLVPNGPWALVGNPNRPDGMRRVHISQLTADEAEQLGLPPPRAGPNVAQPHSFPSV